MPECLLHIGVEKTGSTSVQIALSRNRPRLAAMGILYPQAFGDKNHVKAYAFASEGDLDEIKSPLGLNDAGAVDRFREAVREQFAREIANKRPSTVVISNEHCSSRLLKPSEIERLAALLYEHCSRVKVIVYIRRQGDALRSAYSTYIKTGGVDDFLPPSDEEIQRKYDYDAIVARWAAVFGAENIDVRIFSRDLLSSGDVVVDFMDQFEIDCDGLNLAGERNKSLGQAGTEFLRRFNRLVPYTIGADYNPSRGNIQEIVEAFPDDASFVGNLATIAALDNQMAESNERLRARYLTGHIGPLFPPSDAAASSLEGAGVSEDDIMKVMAFVWETKQQQVLRLKRRLDAAPTPTVANGTDGRAPRPAQASGQGGGFPPGGPGRTGAQGNRKTGG